MNVADKSESNGIITIAFFCPGCKHDHAVYVAGIEKVWDWNGSLEKPSLTPSVLTWNNTSRCHSFVKDGQIRFLNDCTHELAGKTVELEPYD